MSEKTEWGDLLRPQDIHEPQITINGVQLTDVQARLLIAAMECAAIDRWEDPRADDPEFFKARSDIHQMLLLCMCSECENLPPSQRGRHRRREEP